MIRRIQVSAFTSFLWLFILLATTSDAEWEIAVWSVMATLIALCLLVILFLSDELYTKDWSDYGKD